MDLMIAVADSKKVHEKAEIVVRETYENPGMRCFRISAIQLMEQYLGERFSLVGERETKDKGRGVIWEGEYLEGIKIRIFQWDGALKNVYVRYVGNDPHNDLREIREVLGEAGLEKKAAKYDPKP